MITRISRFDKIRFLRNPILSLVCSGKSILPHLARHSSKFPFIDAAPSFLGTVSICLDHIVDQIHFTNCQKNTLVSTLIVYCSRSCCSACKKEQQENWHTKEQMRKQALVLERTCILAESPILCTCEKTPCTVLKHRLLRYCMCKHERRNMDTRRTEAQIEQQMISYSRELCPTRA